jgi:osmoprotectant transport system substrate-binding protein
MKAIAWLVITLMAGVNNCRQDHLHKQVVVASKDFSESELVAELIAQTIEARTDDRVVRRPQYGDTFACYDGILAHKIDIYPEYTGTAYSAVFRLRDGSHDPTIVRNAVARLYRERGMVWLASLGFENTFAAYVREEDAHQRSLATISDLRPAAPGWRLGFGYEFANRRDGYFGLVQEYDLHFRDVKTMNLDGVYDALRSKESERAVDVAIGNSTDGQPATVHLHQLRDDRRYFPPYEAGIVVRSDLLVAHPEVASALGLLANQFSSSQIQVANAEIQIAKRSVADVAGELLRKRGIGR